MTVQALTTDLMLVREADGLELDLTSLQGLWTQEQYLRLSAQTNHLIEFTNGTIEVLPMPTRTHQAILALLYELFAPFVRSRGGKVLFSALRVEISPGTFREPDLVLLLDAADPRNQEAYWLGADLVVEVVSPDNARRDTVVKRADYAEAGIPEYWIVNPLDRTITVLVLHGDVYAVHGVFSRGDRAASVLLDGFEVSVDEVFDAR